MEKSGGAASSAAPTGCYKCGRPGHWSRDCPSNPNSNIPPHPNSSSATTNNNANPRPTSFNSKSTAEKPKKAPRKRPKLTPDILLSNDGLGYVLRHFPRAFKCRGRGHEVNDLRHLLGLYAEWHSRLLPYYSFDQFVHKVEQVGTTNRVRRCIRELRDAVAHGEDPSKLHEPQVQQDNPSHDQDAQGPPEEPFFVEEDTLPNHDTDDFQEDIPHGILEKAIEEVSVSADTSGGKERTNETVEDERDSDCRNQIQISEDQKARMEANRLKALERAAARANNS
ncbi:TIMELESS-interacting [Olea europaea subsp. europaea]|uniref:TIMELESS-interacting n=1 Tax=Olea europaea subsp. europaea TaxID=158383 RepID=A0A8S0UC53_OLEEU|nr:TIMELESS-interacting [Olea europaea subsp. europaea]